MESAVESESIDLISENVEDFSENVSTEKVETERKNKISNPKLTKYERVRILGTRTKQLELGAKAMIQTDQEISYEEIAKLELKHKVIPFKIKRPHEDGTYEIWTIKELDITL